MPRDSAERVHASHARDRGIHAPVFLVGPERTGSTLLRLMLDNHPEIAFQHEFDLAVERMSPAGAYPDMAAFRDYLRTYRFGGYVYEIDPAITDYATLIASMLEQKRRRDGKPRLGATVHHAFDRLLQLWPEASFIKLLRDGRDVACSNIRMGWAGNVYHGAERWIVAERTWEALVARVPAERRIEVRYETLVREPVAELTRLCAWFGVSYSPAMLEYMHTPVGRGYHRPDASLAGQWRRTLRPHDVQLVEARIGDMLIERGYELSGLPRITLGALQRRRLAVQNRFATARHRLRTFGPRLWAASVVSRRVGSRRWRDDVQLRINRVIDAGLR